MTLTSAHIWNVFYYKSHLQIVIYLNDISAVQMNSICIIMNYRTFYAVVALFWSDWLQASHRVVCQNPWFCTTNGNINIYTSIYSTDFIFNNPAHRSYIYYIILCFCTKKIVTLRFTILKIDHLGAAQCQIIVWLKIKKTNKKANKIVNIYPDNDYLHKSAYK